MMRYMWLNKEVWIKTTGGPAVSDPPGQNSSGTQQGASRQNPHLFTTFPPLPVCVSGACCRELFRRRFKQKETTDVPLI